MAPVIELVAGLGMLLTAAAITAVIGPDQRCAACGHERRLHWGDGPCIACVSGGRGTAIAGSVCPCDAFAAAEDQRAAA